MRLQKVHVILYVADQSRARDFYSHVLDMEPTLDVPGMTEFRLSHSTVLGLMPNASIKRLLGDGFPDPATVRGVAKAEVYLMVEDPSGCHTRALAAGARELLSLSQMDWGHDVAYSLDPDGHVLAFARIG